MFHSLSITTRSACFPAFMLPIFRSSPISRAETTVMKSAYGIEQMRRMRDPMAKRFLQPD